MTRGISAIVRLTTEERPEKLDDPGFRRELLDLIRRYVTNG